jgi:hypothetical protein
VAIACGSWLEDAGVVGLVSFAVFHPVTATIVAAMALAVGIVVSALLASRMRPGLAPPARSSPTAVTCSSSRVTVVL